MTGQDLLDYIEDLSREFRTQSGEADHTRALRMLNAAQDHFENLLALIPQAYGGQTGTVTTTASTETTTYPSNVLRIDALWLLDATTSRPTRLLYDIDQPGGHVDSALPWPIDQRVADAVGAPRGAWVNGTSIYWEPLPDATHTIRWYGFQRQSDLTAGGTFAYDDGVALPLALFAIELMRRGLDDPVADYIQMADQIFAPQLRAMKKFRRMRAPGRRYQQPQET